MRKLLFLLLFPFCVSAQFTDDFSDGDFTSNPVWTGDTAKFIINTDTTLQSNGNSTAADTLYLTTPSTIMDSTEWQFFMKLAFNPTATGNYVKVYLVSDQADLKSPLNGYFIRMGETGSSDTLELYEQTGSTETKILTGTSAFGSTTNARIKVTRDNTGIWSLYVDPAGGTNFNIEGTVFDNTHITTGFFGIYCKYSTPSRFDQYFFDDFYVGTIIPDTISPTISTLTVLSDTTLDVQFSEVVEQISAETPGNYSVNNGIGNPSSAVRDGADSSIVHLTFSNAFSNCVTNILVITNIEDLNSNQTLADSMNFIYCMADTAAYRDVVINEIFADPSPQVGLPSAEFIELYNRSGKVLDLNGWEFSDGVTNSTLGTHILLPDDYVILCSMADVPLYSPYGPVLGLSSWPTINNAGDSLTLKDNASLLIDAVNYTNSWYNDNTKDGGGWTLELINPVTVCSGGSNNWTASNNPSGGTPGTQNSVFDTLPDTQSPDLLGVTALSDTTIQLIFSESMDSLSLAAGTYTIDNGITVTTVQPALPDFLNVILYVFPPLDSSTLYTITVLNATDCSGNVINGNTMKFGIGVGAGLFEVVINEIFPDPSPTLGLPEAEFVELYNTTNKVINLTSYIYSDATSSNILPDAIILPYSYLILCANADVSEFQPYGNVIGLSSWPSLNNADDDLSLRDTDSNLIFSVSYSDSWYGDDTKDNGGWTLEMIDPNNPCEEENNWSASNDISGGTPGQQNSINASNPDNVSPSLLRADAGDSVTVLLTFDESLDYTPAAVVSNYLINNGMVVDSVIIQNTTTVILNLSTVLQNGIVYTVTVNNVSDCVGNILGVNNTADFARPEQGDPGDIIINEVLFNPRNGGSDFVEIYNNSNKYINLQGWKIADDDPTPTVITIENPFVVFPGEYIVLTEDGANIKLEYPLSREETFIEMDLPGYNDGDGTVILKTNLTELSDRFDYDEDMHFPLLSDVDGVSLERIDFNRLTDDATNWHSAAENIGFATPGYENSQFYSAEIIDDPITIKPEIFSPDNDGFNDVVNISYEFDTPGFVATVTIYDSKGRLVRYLVQNVLLGTTEGTFSWDGINETSEKARIGIYIILFEVFDMDGNVKKYKNTCVLASQL